MKNNINLLIVIGIMFFVIGCSCGNFSEFTKTEPTSNTPNKSKQTETQSQNQPAENSNKSLEDKVIENTVGGEKIGIKECDEFLDLLGNKIKDENTNMITKLALELLETQVRKEARRMVEENNATSEITIMCREAKKQYESSYSNPTK